MDVQVSPTFTFFIRRNTSGVDSCPRRFSSTNDIDDLNLVFPFYVGHTVHLIIELAEGFFASGTPAELKILAEDLCSKEQVSRIFGWEVVKDSYLLRLSRWEN